MACPPGGGLAVECPLLATVVGLLCLVGPYLAVRWTRFGCQVIVTPERLEFTITTGVNPAEVATVLLSALESRTEMVFRQRGNLSAAEYERVSNAWSLEFDCMTARLADGEPSSAFMRPSGADPRGRT